MRIAYHIQSHKNPAQVLRMVEAIRGGSDGESIMLVSHQTGGEPLTQAMLEQGGEAVLLPSAGGYGDFTHLDRYLESVRWLIEHDDPFDWFVNLSGQDYPLVPMREMEHDLATGDFDASIGFFDVFGPESKWPHSRGHTRYNFRHRRVVTLTHTWERRLRPLGALNLIQPLVRVSPSFGTVGVRRRTMFKDGFHCYGGSFFGAINRACALYVDEFSRTRPEVAEYFRSTLAPDEVYVHTVLGNAGRFTIRPQARRYFDFSLGDGNHPKVLGVADLPRLRASDAWFARKLDPQVDAAVFDELDTLNGSAGRRPRGSGRELAAVDESD